MKPPESDWKMYRKLLPLWRDRYLQAKNQELISLLSQSGKSPTEQFWEAKTQMSEIAQLLNQCLGHTSRSNMLMSMLMMRHHQLIGEADLSQFSDAVRQGSDTHKSSEIPIE